MKYNLRIVLLLVGLFLAAQAVGLGLLYEDIRVVLVEQPGGAFVPAAMHPETAIGPRPGVFGVETLVYILAGVLIGTGLVLLFMRFRQFGLWKALFFFAAFATLSVALGVLLPQAPALLLALLLAALKVFRPHVLLHNATEVLMYSGIALLFVPILDLGSMAGLLLAISAYDAFAVWKSKHMISLARFQAQSRVFAGLAIGTQSQGLETEGAGRARTPKTESRKQKTRDPNAAALGVSQAILGGGDIAFPLLFAGTVFEWLVVSAGVAKEAALAYAFAIPLASAGALFLLLLHSRPGRFYPAMPFLTAGAFAGFGLVVALLRGFPV